MKYLKITMILFVFSLCFSALGANADSMMTYLMEKLPKFKGEVTEGPEKKVTDGPQYYESFGTVDDLTGAYVNVQVKTKDGSGTTTHVLTVGKDEIKTWGDTYNIVPRNDYYIIMNREKWAVTTATHTGTWYLDDMYLKK